ncbi:unnamed protein product [Meloidogyne enterolobii]|uniref:Uncharacterized protein n=1 Tax=Meloidogyne enterolobii TaxID=390850 RepID=A0ACB0YA83_MELEN
MLWWEYIKLKMELFMLIAIGERAGKVNQLVIEFIVFFVHNFNFTKIYTYICSICIYGKNTNFYNIVKVLE